MFHKVICSEIKVTLNYWLCNVNTKIDFKPSTVAFLFYIISVDATHHNRLGKFINDSGRKPNAKMRQVIVNGTPRLFLFAIQDIAINTEIRYDYMATGLWWRKKNVRFYLFICIM